MMQKLILFGLTLVCLGQTVLLAQGRKAKTFHYTDHFQNQSKKEASKVERILNTMYGHYSNKKLADAIQHPMYSHQEAIIIPIWKEKRKGEHWFFATWFAGSFYDKPLLEGFFLMENIGRDSFTVKGFLAPSSRPNEWQLEKPYEDLDPKDLKHHEGCTHLGVWYEKEQEFRWTTPDLCRLPLGDQIAGIKTQSNFGPKGYTNLSEYHTKDGQVLFAYPADQGNFFERLDKKPKKRK